MAVLINTGWAYTSLQPEHSMYIDRGYNESGRQTGKISDMVAFINALPSGSESWFIVNNLPEFYYYTDKQGYYCWFGDWISDIACYQETRGKRVIINTITGNIDYYSSKAGKAKYIISTNTFNRYNRKAIDYLNNYTEIVFKSEDYVIYKIK
jgi:hypothetical protein